LKDSHRRATKFVGEGLRWWNLLRI